MSTSISTDSVSLDITNSPEVREAMLKVIDAKLSALDSEVASLREQRAAVSGKPGKVTKRGPRAQNEMKHGDAVLAALGGLKKGLTTKDLFAKIEKTGHSISKSVLAQTVHNLATGTEDKPAMIVKEAIDADAKKVHYRYRLVK